MIHSFIHCHIVNAPIASWIYQYNLGSPPSQKLQSPFGFFRERWPNSKEEFFIFAKHLNPRKAGNSIPWSPPRMGTPPLACPCALPKLAFCCMSWPRKKRNLEIAGQSNFRTLQVAKSSQNFPSFTFICTFCMRKILQAARQNVLKNVIVQKGDTFSRKYSYVKTPRCVSRYTAWTPLIREYPAWIRSRKEKKTIKTISWHYNFKNFIERSC